MLALRPCHGGDLAPRLAIGATGPAQRRQLAFIDADRAEFARLIDADHALDELPRLEIAGVAPVAGPHGCSLTLRMTVADSTNATPADRIAFQPAIEMPHIDQATWSQRTILALKRYFLSSAGDRPLGIRPEQACGPA